MINETVDIVRDLIANWKIKLKVTEVQDFTTSFVLRACNTSYLHKNSSVILNGEGYTVTDVVKDYSITVTGGVLPIIGTYLISPPFFFHGTLIQTNMELTGIDDMNAKSPMIYLRRPYRDGFNGEDEAIERNSQVTLYFLTEDDFQEPTQEWRDDQCIYPMRAMCYAFIEMLRKNTQIGVIGDYTIEDKIKFGRYSDKGVENKGYWNTNLSGVELDISLPIKRNYVCNC